MERAGERGGERKRKEMPSVEDWPALPDQLCCGRPGRRGQGAVPLANGCVNYIGRAGRWGQFRMNFSENEKNQSVGGKVAIPHGLRRK